MEQQIIEKYIKEVLHNRLKEFEVSENVILKIEYNIREQMYSLLLHWNDIEFRKAILVTAMEEAKFYEPDADIDIKCFVVVTVRNSYIEQIFSDDCKQIEMDKPLNENFIKIITGEAIEYFKNINFSLLSKNIDSANVKDKYGEIVLKYPMAWNALIHLGKCIGNKVIYENKMVKEKINVEQLHNIYGTIDLPEKKHIISEVQSGISDIFSSDLIEILIHLTQSKENIFYADSFKMVTRNFEKLLKIIEILLENGDYFLTSNYLISDSYIGKRSEILRAAHNTIEMNDKITNIEITSGLSKFHRTILEKYIQNALHNN